MFCFRLSPNAVPVGGGWAGGSWGVGGGWPTSGLRPYGCVSASWARRTYTRSQAPGMPGAVIDGDACFGSLPMQEEIVLKARLIWVGSRHRALLAVGALPQPCFSSATSPARH